ncbi:MAG: ABC transporter ATP-binding protein/permease [Ferrovibrio sp.]|uniref:ABC transporter ATP-binding protein/permease n=1 Tax=Ferrovibrio sp. TaxID=1917215 RepID=UPI0026072A43|nr:ABC transporter ATP-binding protein/permease [Ferrovibrio sp.]MCW0235987.1 ABC transporter ATP-binding protein/permease [Ferrovibrio sp.]
MAWGLLAAIVALNLGTVALNVWFNQWNNDFYNALQEKNFDDFQTYLLHFAGMAALFIAVAVYQYYLNQMLQLRWRRWLTEHWLDAWLQAKHYYQMQVFNLGTDNPDQRIAEDMRLFAAYSLNITLGLMNAVVTLASFLHILWGLSGSYSLSLFGSPVEIPGYMVWAALVYAAAGTWITHMIGRKLVPLNFNQQRYEADFRFDLVRVREHAEGIALQNGEAAENTRLHTRFSAVFDNFLAIMRRQKQLIWFTAGYGQAAIIFPFVVAAPRYFGGAIQLGGLMQTASAFGQVQSAFSYLISAYTDIAEWRAVINRLTGFRQGMEQADLIATQSRIAIEITDDERLEVQDLALTLPNGRPLLGLDRLSLKRGDSLLLTGRSGNGKTTLLRAIAGLWPFGQGLIRRSDAGQSLFLPQQPYIPIGTLRAALAYPHDPATYDNAAYREALAAMELGHMQDRLDEEAKWDQVLSGGEQQRVQLAGAWLMKPAWLFLDEATSALDDDTEHRVMKQLRAALPHTTVVSIGHRPALLAFHEQHLELQPAEDGGPSQLVAVT